jgi:hypothetical protein
MMKSPHAAACLAGLAFCVTLQAAFLPISHLDDKTVQAYDAYVEKFERDYVKPFADSGKLWIDGRSEGAVPAKGIIESRMNDDVAEGSIHHFSGSMHVEGARIEDMRRLMEDYPAYPKNFKPDVTEAVAELQPDSTRTDDHYVSHLTLTESTLWMNVQFYTTYDTHYRSLDDQRWISKSVALNLKEQKDAKDVAKGYYPQGDDHGFLWRTQTYWFARKTSSGVDLQVDSISLSRPNVTGFAWFGSKRSHDAVEKMLRDAKTAILGYHK